MDKNKILLVAVVVAIIIVVVLILASKNTTTGTPISTPELTLLLSPTATASARSGAVKKATPTPALSYGDALTQYASRRFQFNEQCQASPTSMSVRNGALVMLDNRSSSARIISLDTVKYSLPAYGFRIVTATTKTLPHTTLINCGGLPSVAQIILN